MYKNCDRKTLLSSSWYLLDEGAVFVGVVTFTLELYEIYFPGNCGHLYLTANTVYFFQVSL